jgi:hypothetical protein
MREKREKKDVKKANLVLFHTKMNKEFLNLLKSPY